MLHIVVLKEDALQVVDDDVDSPVGGVPQPGVVSPPRGDDLQLHHRFFKMWERPLTGCLPDGRQRFLNVDIHEKTPPPPHSRPGTYGRLHRPLSENEVHTERLL